MSCHDDERREEEHAGEAGCRRESESHQQACKLVRGEEDKEIDEKFKLRVEST